MSITRSQLLRYILGRQGLLERQPSTANMDFGVLHGTDHTTPYLSLLARLENFQWEQLADKIYDEGAFTRLRCMRGTIHLVPEDILEAVKCLYLISESEPFLPFREYGIPLDDALEMRFHITEALQLHGAQSSVSIKKLLPPELVNKTYRNKYVETSSIGSVMRWMWQLGLIESGVGVHHWRSKDEKFRLAEELPDDYDEEGKAEAAADLARHYFSLYAPASFADWAWWTGFKMDANRTAFETIKGELVQVQVDGMREELWIPAAQLDALQQIPDEIPRMTRLLPYEDALIKAYKETRYRFYDEDGLAEEVAFSKGGEAMPTMWLDGRIVGLWTWTKKAKEPMTVDPFTQITRDIRKRFKDEVEQVQRFVEASHVLWSI